MVAHLPESSMPSVDTQDVGRTPSPGPAGVRPGLKVVRVTTGGSGTALDRVIANRTHGSILLTGAGCEWTGTSINP
jgi:hypothetical protein